MYCNSPSAVMAAAMSSVWRLDLASLEWGSVHDPVAAVMRRNLRCSRIVVDETDSAAGQVRLLGGGNPSSEVPEEGASTV